MNKRYVVVHPDLGVFVGFAMGFAWWSMLDAAGQKVAVVSEGPRDLLDDLENGGLENCTSVEVQCAHTCFATPDELLTAGVDPAWVFPLHTRLATHAGPTTLQ